MRYSLAVSSIAALIVAATACGGTSGGGSPVGPTPTATITSISISGYTAGFTGVAPQMLTLVATANMSSGPPQNVSALAAWTSDALAVASVAAGGVVTTAGNGLATITASYAGSSGRVTVSVNGTGVAVPVMSGRLDVGPAPAPDSLYRAQLQLNFAELDGRAAYDVTEIQVDWFNAYWVRVTTTILSPGEIAAAMGGSNTVPAGGTRSMSQILDYTYTRSEMTAEVRAQVRDSSGNTSTLTGTYAYTVVAALPLARPAGAVGTAVVRR